MMNDMSGPGGAQVTQRAISHLMCYNCAQGKNILGHFKCVHQMCVPGGSHCEVKQMREYNRKQKTALTLLLKEHLREYSRHVNDLTADGTMPKGGR